MFQIKNGRKKQRKVVKNKMAKIDLRYVVAVRCVGKLLCTECYNKANYAGEEIKQFDFLKESDLDKETAYVCDECGKLIG